MTWTKLFKSELNAVFTNGPLLVTVFAGVIFYSFLYPLPYSEQTPQQQKIAIVNLDQSQLSRTLERMVDATPQIKITEQVNNITDAKLLVTQGKVQGLLLIPPNFYRDLLLKKSPSLILAGNATYFLVYGTIIEGLGRSIGTLSAEMKVTRMLIDGDNIALASSQYSPITLNMKPTFNASIGYLYYVVPAVFILILHQTLLIAMGLITAGQFEKKINNSAEITAKGYYWLQYPVWKIILVRTILILTIYLFLTFYYFGYSFESYGISRLASIEDLLVLIFPFLLSVIFLGIILGLLIPRKELATLIILLTSLPLIFTAGFIWPTSNIPMTINIIAQFFPSTPAITGFLRLNQMGDSIENLVEIRQQLWLLTLLYATIAMLLMSHKQHTIKNKSTK